MLQWDEIAEQDPFRINASSNGNEFVQVEKPSTRGKKAAASEKEEEEEEENEQQPNISCDQYLNKPHFALFLWPMPEYRRVECNIYCSGLNKR